jgi:hypothetical protein
MTRTSAGGRWRHALTLVAALALGAGSCERPAGEDAMREALIAADEVNPCVLLEATMLAVPGEPEPETFEDAQMCLWPRTDFADSALVTVVLANTTITSYEVWLENSEQLLGYRATPEQAQLVEGPGRFAVWIPDGESGTFQFFIDNHMVQIVAGPAAERSALEVCRAFAGIIDRRLP